MKPALDAHMEASVRDIASRIAGSTGLELVLVELLRGGGRSTLRLTIDRAGGVTLDDCAEFSRRVGAVLDAEDPVAGPYNLEVSSPGLDRRLVGAADFERFQGRSVRITLNSPVAGRHNFQGVLAGLEGGEILLQVERGEILRLKVSSVQRAHLIPQL